MSKLILLLILGIWIGLLIGLSFIEAPLKFQAPGITVPLGLGIGRLVFGALNKIEIVFSILLLTGFGLIFNQLGKVLIGVGGLLILIVGIQSIYLLPLLNGRVDLILAGQPVADSNHHIGFIILEVMKLILLFILFTQTYKFIRD